MIFCLLIPAVRPQKFSLMFPLLCQYHAGRRGINQKIKFRKTDDLQRNGTLYERVTGTAIIQIPPLGPRRRGLRIVRDDVFFFQANVIAHSLRRSSFPNRNRFAGLRFGYAAARRFCPSLKEYQLIVQNFTKSFNDTPTAENPWGCKAPRVFGVF